MKELTERQREILTYIHDAILSMGVSPSIHELSEYFGIRQSSAFSHVAALQKKGFLQRSSSARTLSINLQRWDEAEFPHIRAVPLYDMDVATPLSSASIRHVFPMYYCDLQFCRLRKNEGAEHLFALKVNVDLEQGKDVGIFLGDILLMSRFLEAPEAGDFILAYLHERYILCTCNPLLRGQLELHPITPNDPVLSGHRRYLPICGRVLQVYRSYGKHGPMDC